MATKKQTNKVLLELELSPSKLKKLKPLIKDGKIKVILGEKSFIACNAPFVACNAAFTEKTVAFLACNAAFVKE